MVVFDSVCFRFGLVVVAECVGLDCQAHVQSLHSDPKALMVGMSDITPRSPTLDSA
jgi:hypothetical protein